MDIGDGYEDARLLASHATLTPQKNAIEKPEGLTHKSPRLPEGFEASGSVAKVGVCMGSNASPFGEAQQPQGAPPVPWMTVEAVMGLGLRDWGLGLGLVIAGSEGFGP